MPSSVPSEAARQAILYGLKMGLVAVILGATQILVNSPEHSQTGGFARIQKSARLWLHAQFFPDGVIQANGIRTHALHDTKVVATFSTPLRSVRILSHVLWCAACSAQTRQCPIADATEWKD